jgi:hypothetical protein
VVPLIPPATPPPPSVPAGLRARPPTRNTDGRKALLQAVRRSRTHGGAGLGDRDAVNQMAFRARLKEREKELYQAKARLTTDKSSSPELFGPSHTQPLGKIRAPASSADELPRDRQRPKTASGRGVTRSRPTAPRAPHSTRLKTVSSRGCYALRFDSTDRFESSDRDRGLLSRTDQGRG